MTIYPTSNAKRSLSKRDVVERIEGRPTPQEPHASSARWYAFYTSPRSEKKVAQRLQEQGFECYLPLVKTMKIWSDRKKMVEIPLINSYIFVKVQEYQLREINNIQGISRYISFEGKPGVIPEYQINNLKILVNSDEDIKLRAERMSLGDSVEVTHGNLKGLKGRLTKLGSRNKVVVCIDRLDLNLEVKIQKAFLKVVK